MPKDKKPRAKRVPPAKPQAQKAKVKAQPVANEDDGNQSDAHTSKRLVVKWDNDRTNRLLDWLDQNPDNRNRLFSDSTVAAKQEGRRKVTAKGNKGRYHEALAKAVFNSPEEDPSLRNWYLKEPQKFATSVCNYLSRLRVLYRDFNKELGKTGAGLKYDDITPGSDIHNLIDQLMVDFPYWERLHGYWRTLPNYNPVTVTSDPGQDLESDALALIGGTIGDGDDAESMHEEFPPEERANMKLDADADDEDEIYVAGSDSENAKALETPTPRGAANQVPPLSFGTSRKGNAAALTKTSTSVKKVSPAGGRTASGSSLGKRSALTAFGVDAENDSRLAAAIRSKRLDRDVLGLEVQKAKIGLLAQRESAQNSRKAEENQIKMLELQLQLQLQQPQQAANAPAVPNVRQQMVPVNVDMGFGNGNLGMQDFLNAPFNNSGGNHDGGTYHRV